MNLFIRPYQAADWQRLCHIHDRARLDELRGSVDLAAFLPLADTAEAEGLFNGPVWVACRMDEVVGFVAVADDEITWLYVDPDSYGQGIGRHLLHYAIARCGAVVTTEAFAGNIRAISLYRSAGFEIVETRTGKLNGNEQFTATGVKLQLQKASG